MMPPGVHMFTTAELCILAGIVLLIALVIGWRK